MYTYEIENHQILHLQRKPATLVGIWYNKKTHTFSYFKVKTSLKSYDFKGKLHYRMEHTFIVPWIMCSICYSEIVFVCFLWTGGKMPILHHYEKDVSLGYGADWCYDASTDNLIATCSFYNHSLQLWRLTTQSEDVRWNKSLNETRVLLSSL